MYINNLLRSGLTLYKKYVEFYLILFYGWFVKYLTTTNWWSTEQSDVIIYTDRFYRCLCFMKIAEFPPGLLTRFLKFKQFFKKCIKFQSNN